MTMIDATTDHSDTCKLLTVIDAAGYLAISRGAVHNLLNTRAVMSIHIGRACASPR